MTMARPIRLLGFAAHMAREVLVATLLVAREVVSPRPARSARLVTVPIRSSTDTEVTMLVCLLALTPGTLPVEIADGQLVVHSIHAPSAGALRTQVADLENRLLRVMR